MKENLLKKFLSFSYGSFIGLIIGFLTTLVTTRILTPDEFGKASMFTLAVNVIMIFITFGTDQAFVRFFYEEKEEKRGGLLYNCLKLPLIILIISIIILVIFRHKASLFLFGEYNIYIIALLELGILVQALYRYATLVIRMQKKGHLFSLLEILNKSIQLVIIFILFYLIKPDYTLIVFSTVATFFILTIVAIRFEKNYWSFKNFNVKDLRHNKLDIIKYSYPLLFQTLIFWLFQSFDRIALRNWSDFHEIGLFVAASKIIALLNVFQVAFTTFWTPICFEAFQKDPKETKLYETMSQIVAFVMFIIGIFIIMFKDIIMKVLGADYSDASNIIPFLVFTPIMFTMSETTVIGINFFKKTNWHIFIAIISCVSNIIGNWLLVPQWGAFGAALSTALSYIVFYTLRTLISLKYFKVKFNLVKVYIVIALIIAYGFYSTYYHEFFKAFILGIAILLTIVVLYLELLKNIYKKICVFLPKSK